MLTFLATLLATLSSILAGGAAWHFEGAPSKVVLLGWGSSLILTRASDPAKLPTCAQDFYLGAPF